MGARGASGQLPALKDGASRLSKEGGPGRPRGFQGRGGGAATEASRSELSPGRGGGGTTEATHLCEVLVSLGEDSG